MGDRECHQDDDDADNVLDGQGEAESVYAKGFKREYFVTEAQVKVHAVKMAEQFADGADKDPVNNPIVSVVQGDDAEDDEEGPH